MVKLIHQFVENRTTNVLTIEFKNLLGMFTFVKNLGTSLKSGVVASTAFFVNISTPGSAKVVSYMPSNNQAVLLDADNKRVRFKDVTCVDGKMLTFTCGPNKKLLNVYMAQIYAALGHLGIRALETGVKGHIHIHNYKGSDMELIWGHLSVVVTKNGKSVKPKIKNRAIYENDGGSYMSLSPPEGPDPCDMNQCLIGDDDNCDV
jgi:hypothetical protein